MTAADENSEERAQDVCRRMAALRRELSTDVEQVSESARAMTDRYTDWTFYVRRFPWVAVGIAAAAGFMIVPRKKTVVRPTREQLEELAGSRHFASAATAELKPKRTMLQGLVATAAAMAGRYALAYVTEQLQAAATKSSRNPAKPMAATGNGLHDREP